jgi:parallel beta-helix repeat protein
MRAHTEDFYFFWENFIMKTLSSLFVRAVLLAHVAFLCAGAHAQSCGSVLSGDITLTSDLHCTTSYFAFEINGGGAITISLNGHTLSGTRALQGFGLYGATDVTIKGPGTIKGFWSGINGGQAHGLTVVDVQFEDLGFGISLNNTERTYFANNSFKATDTAIWLKQGSSDPAAGLHTITGNEFSDNRVGVSLCGYDTGGSSIYRNKFLRTTETAIHLRDGTHHNEVAANQIYETGSAGIRLSGSSNNKLANRLEYGNVGIAFEPYFTGACHTGPLANADVFGNQMNGSHVFKFKTAVWLGFGGSTPSVYKNNVVWNKLYDNEVGIRFASDAVDNDAQRNGFGRTITPIIDEGTGNMY